MKPMACAPTYFGTTVTGRRAKRKDQKAIGLGRVGTVEHPTVIDHRASSAAKLWMIFAMFEDTSLNWNSESKMANIASHTAR